MSKNNKRILALITACAFVLGNVQSLLCAQEVQEVVTTQEEVTTMPVAEMDRPYSELGEEAMDKKIAKKRRDDRKRMAKSKKGTYRKTSKSKRSRKSTAQDMTGESSSKRDYRRGVLRPLRVVPGTSPEYKRNKRAKKSSECTKRKGCLMGGCSMGRCPRS